MKMLAEDWKYILQKAWSVRVAIFWAVFTAGLAIVNQAADLIPLWLFSVLSIFGNVTIVLARIMNQPGADL